MAVARTTLKGIAIGFFKFVLFVLLPLEALRILGFPLTTRALYAPIWLCSYFWRS